jgi:hypothetical protein
MCRKSSFVAYALFNRVEICSCVAQEVVTTLAHATYHVCMSERFNGRFLKQTPIADLPNPDLSLVVQLTKHFSNL